MHGIARQSMYIMKRMCFGHTLLLPSSQTNIPSWAKECLRHHRLFCLHKIACQLPSACPAFLSSTAISAHWWWLSSTRLKSLNTWTFSGGNELEEVVFYVCPHCKLGLTGNWTQKRQTTTGPDIFTSDSEDAAHSYKFCTTTLLKGYLLPDTISSSGMPLLHTSFQDLTFRLFRCHVAWGGPRLMAASPWVGSMENSRQRLAWRPIYGHYIF